MTDERTARWERIRAKGKARYVLLRGVLAFTLIGAAVVIVFWYTRSYTNIADLWTMGIAYPFLGLAAGYVNWTINERRYRIVTGHEDPKT